MLNNGFCINEAVNIVSPKFDRKVVEEGYQLMCSCEDKINRKPKNERLPWERKAFKYLQQERARGEYNSLIHGQNVFSGDFGYNPEEMFNNYDTQHLLDEEQLALDNRFERGYLEVKRLPSKSKF